MDEEKVYLDEAGLTRVLEKSKTEFARKEPSYFSLSPASVVGSHYRNYVAKIYVSNRKGNITVSSDDPTIATATAENDVIYVKYLNTGSTTMRVTDLGNKLYSECTKILSVDINVFAIPSVSWTTGSDDDIVSMIQLSDEGEIDLYEDLGWRVGDERRITIDAISKTGTFDGVTWNVNESHTQQDITLVLMDHGSYDLVEPVPGKDGKERTKCSFVVGTKHSLVTTGALNNNQTSLGSWDACTRRSWCNGGFRSAIPENIRGIFKKFNTKTAREYNVSEIKVSEDYFALSAEKEVIGSSVNSVAIEGQELSQFEYYKTAANRYKKNGESTNTTPAAWWLRSPYKSENAKFIIINASIQSVGYLPQYALGLSPFGCI